MQTVIGVFLDGYLDQSALPAARVVHRNPEIGNKYN